MTQSKASKKVVEEQTKLYANFLNALASGTILVSVVAPYIGIGMGTLSPATDLLHHSSLAALGITIGFILHAFGQRALKRLED